MNYLAMMYGVLGVFCVCVLFLYVFVWFVYELLCDVVWCVYVGVMCGVVCCVLLLLKYFWVCRLRSSV